MDEPHDAEADSNGFSITRCYIDGREGEVWFRVRADGTIVIQLDRAAIVALEVFDPAHPRHDSTMRDLREAGERVARGVDPWGGPRFDLMPPAFHLASAYGAEPLMGTPDIGGES